MNQPPIIRTPIIRGETPFRLDGLIADTSDRVRLDKHTSEPVRHTPEGNWPETHISGAARLDRVRLDEHTSEPVRRTPRGNSPEDLCFRNHAT